MELNIHSFVTQHQLIQKGDHILLAVSGGPDSTALLHWFVQQQEKLHLTLRVVHVNHQLRGEQSDLDQKYVEKLCHSLDVPCSSIAVDVVTYARTKRLSKQVAARECRYTAFEQVVKQYGLQKVALAHHADDQVETVLMRLLRGSGLKGLSGIPPRREAERYTIIRPFLCLSKSSLEQYCADHGLTPRLDESNFTDDYTRNYVRNHVTPLLVKLNPKLHTAIGEMSDVLREENEWMDNEAKKYAKEVIERKETHKITINLSKFRHMRLPLQRRVILLILNCLSESGSDWSKVHIDQLLELCIDENGTKQIHLPYGILALKEYKSLTFHRRDTIQEHQVDHHYIYLPLEGELEVPEMSLRITTQQQSCPSSEEAVAPNGFSEPAALSQTNASGDSWRGKRFVAYFDIRELSPPLILRNRKAGDKIQPLGMKGHQKVKDIFIDAKVPLKERQTWPLITDQRDILWIPGIKRADRSKVNQQTQQMIVITVEKW